MCSDKICKSKVSSLWLYYVSTLSIARARQQQKISTFSDFSWRSREKSDFSAQNLIPILMFWLLTCFLHNCTTESTNSIQMFFWSREHVPSISWKMPSRQNIPKFALLLRLLTMKFMYTVRVSIFPLKFHRWKTESAQVSRRKIKKSRQGKAVFKLTSCHFSAVSIFNLFTPYEIWWVFHTHRQSSLIFNLMLSRNQIDVTRIDYAGYQHTVKLADIPEPV